MNTQSQLMMIKPEQAAMWLAANTNNRPMQGSAVLRYATDMKAGNWQCNGETIKIAMDGTLLDGQHRLAAIVKAEMPIEMFVVQGLPLESFRTIDVGMRRSSAQILGLAGFQNTTSLASAARWVNILESGRSCSLKTTTPEIQDVIDRHPLLTDYAKLHSKVKAKRLFPACCLAPVVLAAEKHGQTKVNAFLNAVLEGAGIMQEDPAYALRERFFSSTRGSRIEADVAVGLTIKCLNAHMEGRKIKLLRMGKDEPMPVLG